MEIQTYYSYLTRARRDLWTFLESMPDDALSKSVIPADRMRSIKDLVLHIAVVEDSWIHEDILRDSPVWESASGFPKAFEVPYHESKTLAWLLEYWRAVETSTLAYFETLNDAELERVVTMPSEQGDVQFKAHDLLWHVVQHETRHTAQIVLLARLAGHAPPQLDLVKYLWREAGQ
jgi:uncharacterized damage-inducible protein DinB